MVNGFVSFILIYINYFGHLFWKIRLNLDVINNIVSGALLNNAYDVNMQQKKIIKKNV